MKKKRGNKSMHNNAIIGLSMMGDPGLKRIAELEEERKRRDLTDKEREQLELELEEEYQKYDAIVLRNRERSQ